MSTQTEKTNIISIEYTDKARRDARRASGENLIFLDISQKLYLQVQRGEKATLLLDAVGTWRNSLFVLMGQYLYVNFHLYNEKRILEPETHIEKSFLILAYQMQGTMPSHIIKCQPATAVKSGESWQIVKKGWLFLK